MDSVEVADEEEKNNFPIELLNSLSPSGMPRHQLKVKVDSIVMLLRSINTKRGLCNGTRLIVISLKKNLIQAEVLMESAQGENVFIPRINLKPSELPIPLKRRQFQVKVAFAVTLNKSQGETLGKVRIYLPEPVFGHGQLYVAFSIVRKTSDVSVKVIDTPQQGELVEASDKVFTRNVVNQQVL